MKIISNINFNRLSNKKTGLILALIIGTLFLSGFSKLKLKNFKPKQNVLLLLIDCARFDKMSCYGYPLKTTPFIDELAKKSFVFTNAYSNAPWTRPAVATLFTSVYSFSNKCSMQIKDADVFQKTLPLKLVTMAEIISKNGYSTFFVNGGNGSVSNNTNFDQGFQKYIMNPYNITTANTLINQCIQQIKEMPQPFFGYLHFMDVHVPYPKNKFVKEFWNSDDHFFNPAGFSDNDATLEQLMKKYHVNSNKKDSFKNYLSSIIDSELRYIDEQIERLFTYLKENNLDDNTIVIILADHGEELFEHNEFGHGHTLYNELLHVPLIVYWPNKNNTKRPLIRKKRVDLASVLPTLLDMLNISYSFPYKINGSSFVSLFDNKTNYPNRPIFAASLFTEKKDKYINHVMSIQNDEYKLIKTKKDYDLFNIKTDDKEQNNIFKKTPISNNLIKLLTKYSKTKTSLLGKKIKVDKQTKQNLRSLGYL